MDIPRPWGDGISCSSNHRRPGLSKKNANWHHPIRKKSCRLGASPSTTATVTESQVVIWNYNSLIIIIITTTTTNNNNSDTAIKVIMIDGGNKNHPAIGVPPWLWKPCREACGQGTMLGWHTEAGEKLLGQRPGRNLQKLNHYISRYLSKQMNGSLLWIYNGCFWWVCSIYIYMFIYLNIYRFI